MLAWKPLCTLALSFLLCGGAVRADDTITGVVRDADTLAPVAGAIVTLQATPFRTTSLGDGSYALLVPDATDYVVVAANKGYFNRSALVSTTSTTGIDLLMDPVPQEDDLGYEFVGPSGCSFCHFSQVSEWEDSPMGQTGDNRWVYDLYAGTGTPGGMNGFVYTRDSPHAVHSPNAECASCHQPERWIASDYDIDMDPNLGNPSDGALHGVSCEACHKIADVNEATINTPGIHPDTVTFTLPAGPLPDQVLYGVLGDVDFNSPKTMRASYNPQLEAAVCGTCHQDANDPDEDGDYNEPGSVIAQPTFLEWRNSPYGDENSPMYASCVDCHMPPSGENTVCTILFPEIFRDPATIRSHDIRGTTPEYLENAVELDLDVSQSGTTLQVDVDITNTLTGHHVPTGVTVRNMILLVEAWTDDGDPLTDPLPFTGEQLVDELGGVGDPANGYYAGLPGRLFGKKNHDASLNGPVLFTEATGIEFDNRIPALATDSSSYTFLAPPPGETVHVRARLIYRRGYRFLIDTKGWTTTGLGKPLEDLMAPHFGHLMESSASDVLVAPAQWTNLGAAKVGATGVPVLQGVGPLTPDSGNSLELSAARAHAQSFLIVGLSALDAQFKGGTLVPTPDWIVPFMTDRLGERSFPFLWRAGLPTGLQLYTQVWVSDDTASFNLAASNGLLSTGQ